MIDDASHRLRDAGVLWVLDGSFDRVVDAAVACLVAGTSSYSLDMLAGAGLGTLGYFMAKGKKGGDGFLIGKKYQLVYMNMGNQKINR